MAIIEQGKQSKLTFKKKNKKTEQIGFFCSNMKTTETANKEDNQLNCNFQIPNELGFANKDENSPS